MPKPIRPSTSRATTPRTSSSILTSLAFGTRIAAEEIYMEGISNISQADIRAAGELGYRIKLLGVAQRTESGIEQRVHPTMVPTASVIAQVHGVTNAVAIETDILGELLLSGPGAGGKATASAVIGDIADIAKSRPGFQHGPVFGRPAKRAGALQQGADARHAGGYFIRLTVHDRIGVFAGHRQAHGRERDLAGIDRPASAGLGPRTEDGDPGHPRDHRGRRAQGRGRHHQGWPADRQAAGHPHRARRLKRGGRAPRGSRRILTGAVPR